MIFKPYNLCMGCPDYEITRDVDGQPSMQDISRLCT